MYIQNKDVKIYTESFGDKKNIAFLLVIGAGAVSSLYPDDFCRKLAQTGLFVVRFDLRDYGRSTHFPSVSPDLISSISPENIPSELPYKMEDFIFDILAIMGSYSIDKAHFIGYSMGGAIVQILAVEHPERVLSITLMSTGPQSYSLEQPEIPQETWDVLLANQTTGDYEKDKPGWLNSMLYLHGSYPFDKKRALSYLKDIYKYEKNVDVAWNHIAVQKAGPELAEELKKLNIPTLIIHGEEDKLQPIESAKLLQKLIPKSTLFVLPRAGHMFFHKDIWRQILKKLTSHLSKNI